MKITPVDRKKAIIVLPQLKEILKRNPQFAVITTTPTLKTATKLFVDIIETFKSGKISGDELSVFGDHLFYFATKYPNSDLFGVTLAASEIAFYIRYSPERLTQFLQIIDKFYINHKSKTPPP